MGNFEIGKTSAKDELPEGKRMVEEIRQGNFDRLAMLGNAPLEIVMHEGTDPTYQPYRDAN